LFALVIDPDLDLKDLDLKDLDLKDLDPKDLDLKQPIRLPQR